MLTRIIRSLTSRTGGEVPLPPEPLQQFVGGNFTAVGEEFLGYLKEFCSLKPADAVLDIGCGSGRIALPLTHYLNSQGLYRGFDVSDEAIRWCQKNISRRFPNFEFIVSDVKNGPYNPKSHFKSSEYRFPYPSETFDVVFLASVFTHMFQPDLMNYMREIYRVLKPGGRCLATFFILNEESIRLTAENKGKLNFEFTGPGYRTIDAKTPEEGLAYPEAFVRGAFAEVGLSLRNSIEFGSWCGREKFLSFQDITISTK